MKFCKDLQNSPILSTIKEKREIIPISLKNAFLSPSGRSGEKIESVVTLQKAKEGINE